MSGVKVFTDLSDELKALEKHPNPERARQLLEWYNEGGFDTLKADIGTYLAYASRQSPKKSPVKKIEEKTKSYLKKAKAMGEDLLTKAESALHIKMPGSPKKSTRWIKVSFGDPLKVYSLEVPMTGNLESLKEALSTQFQIAPDDIQTIDTNGKDLANVRSITVKLKPYNLNVIDPEGKRHPLQLTPMDSVQQAKENLANFTNLHIPAHRQVMYVGDQVVANDDRLVPTWLSEGRPPITVLRESS